MVCVSSVLAEGFLLLMKGFQSSNRVIKLSVFQDRSWEYRHNLTDILLFLESVGEIGPREPLGE